MDCSTPGFPVHHQLLELTQTHVLQVRDAIQPSHPLQALKKAVNRCLCFSDKGVKLVQGLQVRHRLNTDWPLT